MFAKKYTIYLLVKLVEQVLHQVSEYLIKLFTQKV